MTEKPHARNYISIAIIIVFLLNMLFSWTEKHVISTFLYFAQFFTVLVEVGVTSLLTFKFVKDSNKYNIGKKIEEALKEKHATKQQ